VEIKVIISNMTSPPEKPAKAPSLEEKISYAIDCIACNVQKKKAIKFLQDVKARLETEKHPTRESQDLLNKVGVAIADYGHYHIET
jgi:hypothetical protein